MKKTIYKKILIVYYSEEVFRELIHTGVTMSCVATMNHAGCWSLDAGFSICGIPTLDC